MSHRINNIKLGKVARTAAALVCGLVLSACNIGSPTPMSTAKPASDLATLELPACHKVSATAANAVGVAQHDLDRWLVELAGSFAGHHHAVSRSDLKTTDGSVLVRSGEVVRSIAGRRLATREAVVRLYGRLIAPAPLAVVTVESGEEMAIRSRVVAAPGQAAFLANSAELVVASKGDTEHLARLAFRAMRRQPTLVNNSAQWRSNGRHGGGLRLESVRPGWLYDGLGLREGDLVRSVDGVVYGSPGQLQRALYTASLAASNDDVVVAITRDGEHRDLRFTFVGPSYQRRGVSCSSSELNLVATRD